MTSHAAVVARGMGTCCVSGCGEIKIDEDAGLFTLGGKTIKEGDYISLDGSTGNIYGEAIATVEASISGDFGRYMGWADKARRLNVRTNADNPRDAAQAVKFGAEGIGLCRTEHMFFEADRIQSMREMIVAKDCLLYTSGGDEQHALLALGHAFEGGSQRYLGFAEAHVPAEQPIHRDRAFHVPLDLVDAAELVFGLLIFEMPFEIILPFGIRAEGVAGGSHPLGIELDQLLGDILDRRPHPGFGLLPFLSAQTVELHLHLVLGARCV